MQKVFSIPTDYHLKKFVEKEFLEGYNEPFPIDERSILGKQIFSYLIDKRSQLETTREYESILTLSLSDTLAKRSPDLKKLSRINSFLEDIFKRSLIIWVRSQMNLGNNRYQSLINFLKYYDLHSMEMIDRYYQFVKRSNYFTYRLQKKNEKDEQDK
jgi:hypothetical protein